MKTIVSRDYYKFLAHVFLELFYYIFPFVRWDWINFYHNYLLYRNKSLIILFNTLLSYCFVAYSCIHLLDAVVIIQITQDKSSWYTTIKTTNIHVLLMLDILLSFHSKLIQRLLAARIHWCKIKRNFDYFEKLVIMMILTFCS